MRPSAFASRSWSTPRVWWSWATPAWLAAQRLGLAQVPVHVAADLSPAQARAYRLADNRTGQETGWDPELLALRDRRPA